MDRMVDKIQAVDRLVETLIIDLCKEQMLYNQGIHQHIGDKTAQIVQGYVSTGLRHFDAVNVTRQVVADTAVRLVAEGRVLPV